MSDPLEQPRRTGFDFQERVERDYQADRDWEAAMDRDDSHTPRAFQKVSEDRRWRMFTEPPTGWRLVWDHGDEPRLERAA